MNPRPFSGALNALLIGMVALGAGCAHLGESGSGDVVSGFYDGDWYGPDPDRALGELTCTIVATGVDAWDATFFASFGGFGEYEVGLDGRREGDKVVFGGSVDLGATSGGVFEWHGEIVGDQFNGSYTSSMINGTFKMVKAPRPTGAGSE